MSISIYLFNVKLYAGYQIKIVFVLLAEFSLFPDNMKITSSFLQWNKTESIENEMSEL